MASGNFEPISNAADWQDSVDCTDETGAAVDLTGCTINLELRNAGNSVVLTGSTTAGEITITDASFEIFFPASRLTSIPAGVYRLNAKVTTPDGDIDQLFAFDVSIFNGGFN